MRISRFSAPLSLPPLSSSLISHKSISHKLISHKLVSHRQLIPSHLIWGILPLVWFGLNLRQTAYSQPAIGNEPSLTQGPALSSPSSAIRPVLTLGSEGDSVAELQAMLKLLGYYSGAVDGIYRASTAAAVSAFQQAAGLQADGVAGPDTWSRLLPSAPPVAAASAVSPGTSFPSPSVSPSVPPSVSPAPTPQPAVPPTSAPQQAVEEPSTIDGSTSSDTQAALVDIDLPILRIGMRGPAVARLQDRLRVLGFFQGVVDGIFGSETLAAVQAAQRSYELDPDGVVGPATWTVLLER
jgi:N-acetylmuramoyl-L-alanine amidase